MNFLCSITSISILLLTAQTHGAPTDATKVQETWKSACTSWSDKARRATTQEALSEIAASRPNPTTYAQTMWAVIGKHLEQEWTLEHAAWYLLICNEITNASTNQGSQAPFLKECQLVRKTIISHHLKSPLLIPMCSALAEQSDPLSLSVLEKISTTNPDPKIQGVAALGASMILAKIGDNPELMSKRLTYLRKAIIESADVTIGQTTVAQIAENELYQIRFLSKGRTAPDLTGTDAHGNPLQLSSYLGKVVVLAFWNNNSPQSEHFIEVTNAMMKKFQGKPIVILGVNTDSTDQLKTMESEKTVTWKNFSDPSRKLAKSYRAPAAPIVFVLDQRRKIEYVGNQGTFAELSAEALLPSTR